MTRILVYPERLTDVGRRFISDGEHIAQIGQGLSGAVGGLDWESRARIGMEDDFAAARARAEGLGQQLISHGQRLIEIAERFERADNEAAQDVATIPWENLGAGAPPVVTPKDSSDLDSIISQAELLGIAPVVATGLGRGLDIWELARTEFRADLRTYGRLLNALVGNKHAGFVGRMESLTNFIHVRDARKVRLPKWTVVDAGLEFVAGGDYSWRGAAIAGVTAIATQALLYLVPGMGTVMAGIAFIQLSGHLTMWGLDAIGKKEWAERGRKFLDTIDLNRYIREGAELIVDGGIEAVSAISRIWQQPAVSRISRLGTFAFGT